MSEGRCHYCMSPGRRIAGPEDGPWLKDDLHVCAKCWKLLQDPKTGPSLVRGDLSIELRGVVPEEKAEKMIQALMDLMGQWRPRN